MEKDLTAKLSKVDMNEAEAAAALASALSYALSGIDLIPRIIRSQGEDGIPLVEAYQTMMAESIFDAMMAIGMGNQGVLCQSDGVWHFLVVNTSRFDE